MNDPKKISRGYKNGRFAQITSTSKVRKPDAIAGPITRTFVLFRSASPFSHWSGALNRDATAFFFSRLSVNGVPEELRASDIAAGGTDIWYSCPQVGVHLAVP
jgi:hypothetical protein